MIEHVDGGLGATPLTSERHGERHGERAVRRRALRSRCSGARRCWAGARAARRPARGRGRRRRARDRVVRRVARRREQLLVGRRDGRVVRARDDGRGRGELVVLRARVVDARGVCAPRAGAAVRHRVGELERRERDVGRGERRQVLRRRAARGRVDGGRRREPGRGRRRRRRLPRARARRRVRRPQWLAVWSAAAGARRPCGCSRATATATSAELAAVRARLGQRARRAAARAETDQNGASSSASVVPNRRTPGRSGARGRARWLRVACISRFRR